VRVGRRDASYAFKVLSEFVRFFRRPEHWRTLEDVKRFIGDKRDLWPVLKLELESWCRVSKADLVVDESAQVC